MNDIIEICKNYCGEIVGFLAVLSIFIQISPIKINPLSWIKKICVKCLNWLGNQLNRDIVEKIDQIEKKLNKVEQGADERYIEATKWQILEFSKLVKKNEYEHESYNHIFKIHKDYDDLLALYGKTNGEVTRAMKLIEEKYEEHKLDENF